MAQTTYTPKQVGLWSVRNQFIGLLVVASIAPLIIVSILTVNQLREAEIQTIQNNFEAIVDTQAFSVADLLQSHLNLLRLAADNELIETSIVAANEAYVDGDINNAAIDAQWQEAIANGTTIPQMDAVLNNVASNELRELSAIQPSMIELFTTDRFGRVVSTNSLLPGDYDQADEIWWQNTFETESGYGYIAPKPEVDESTGILSLQLAVPIEKDNTRIGVLRASIDITSLQNNLEALQIGETGEIFILNENSETLITDDDVAAHFDFPSDLVSKVTSNNGQLITIYSTDNEPYIAQAAFVDLNHAQIPPTNSDTDSLYSIDTLIEGLGWYFLVIQAESEALAGLNTAINNAAIAVIAIIGILAILGYIVASRFIQPISQLAAAADVIGRGGDWTGSLSINRNDEFGLLSDAFNHMASSLSTNFASLEKIVSERTKDLETSADIASAANQVREVDDLISLTVNLIRDRFNYHYVQVYLIDSTQQNAILRDGTGQIGKGLLQSHHYIPLDTHSLVAEAVRTGQITVVQDTQSESTFSLATLLPETRSQMTIPLRRKNTIIGVLDIQHDEPGIFTQDQQQLFQSLADQLAVTFENVQLLQQTDKRARQLATVAKVSVEAASNLDINELLKSVATLTRDSFGLYHVHIFLLHKQTGILLLAAGSGEAGTMMVEQGHSIALNREDSLVAKAARIRQPVMVNDVTQEPSFLPNTLLPLTRSELAVPLIAGKETVGVLDVQSEKTDFFTEHDAQAHATLASQIAVAIQNARAYQALERAQNRLQKSEERLDLALRGTSDGLWDWNTYTNDLYLSPGWKRMLGFEDHEFKNTFDAWEAALHPGDLERFTQAISDYLEGNANVFEIEYRLRHKDGQYRHILARGGAETDKDGNITRLAGTHTDITERVLAQEALKASEADAQAAREDAQILYQISALLSEAEDETQILNAIVDMGIITDLSFITLSVFDQYDYEKSKLIKIVAEWNQVDNLLLGMNIPFEQLPFIQMVDRNEIIYVANTHDDPSLDKVTQELMHQLDVTTFAIVPLTIGPRWLGFLTLYHHDQIAYSKKLTDLLYSLSRQLAIALERVYLQRQTNQYLSRLETVAQVSTNTISIRTVDHLLEAVVNLTKERFNRYHTHIYLFDKKRNDLVLAAGAGEIGKQMVQEGHHIHLDAKRSLVARAGRTLQSVIIQDITLEPDFLPNKYLPDTRSEMAIPIAYDNELIGVLDIQDDRPNQFSDIDVQVKHTLANQVAIALRNAEAFERERQTVKRLLEVDRLKQEFLANMSHELRTPLNSIIGYSEVLLDGLDGDLSDEAQEDVEAIFLSGKHLLNLINEILDLAKIEAGQMQLHHRELDVAEIIRNLVSQNEILVKNKPISLQIVEENEVPTIQADPTRLNQILLNLLSNAIKFTEEGHITIRYGMQDDETLVVRIKDTGIGMNSEALERVFERFHQADGSSTRRAGGTGLGLTITRQLIQMHGGEIYCESEEGVGSVFWFTLPINPLIAKDNQLEAEITD